MEQKLLLELLDKAHHSFGKDLEDAVDATWDKLEGMLSEEQMEELKPFYALLEEFYWDLKHSYLASGTSEDLPSTIQTFGNRKYTEYFKANK
jgi:hypothetical protein